MPSFNHFPNRTMPASSLHSFWTHPRFLRTFSSLMLLTTAIAWGASSHAGELTLGADLRGGTGLMVAAGPTLGIGLGAGVGLGTGAMTGGNAAGVANAGVNADVRTGTNSNVTAEQRMSAMGAVGAGTKAQGSGGINAAGGISGVAEGARQTVGGVRDTTQAVGSAVEKTGQPPTQGVKAEASGGFKDGANTGTHNTSIGAQGAGKASAAGGRTGSAMDTEAGTGVKGVIPTR